MPDTNASLPIFESDQVNDASAAASAVVEAVVRWDECVSLIGQPGFDAAQALNQAAQELRKQAVRCVRVAGSVNGGLALRPLIAQILGRTGLDTLTDADLQAGFEALVEPGPGNQRVALLIGDAQTLHPASLRYIQLACRTSPKLRVVLAGQAGLSRHLAADEFSELRRRITRRLVMPGAASASSANALPPAPPPPPAPGRGPRAPSWQVGRLGLIALLALLIGTMVWRHLPKPPEAGTRAPEPMAEAPAEPAVQPAASAVPVAEPGPPDAGPPPEQKPPQAEAGSLASAPAPDAAASASSVPPPEPSAADAPGLAALQEEPVGVDLLSLQEADLLEAVANASPTSIPDEAPAPERPPSVGNAADRPAVAAADAARSERARPPHDRRPSGRAERAAAAKTTPSPPPRDVTAKTPASFPTADQRRCREITMRSQLGRTPTGSEIEFLRTGCRSN